MTTASRGRFQDDRLVHEALLKRICLQPRHGARKSSPARDLSYIHHHTRATIPRHIQTYPDISRHTHARATWPRALCPATTTNFHSHTAVTNTPLAGNSHDMRFYPPTPPHPRTPDTPQTHTPQTHTYTYTASTRLRLYLQHSRAHSSVHHQLQVNLP